MLTKMLGDRYWTPSILTALFQRHYLDASLQPQWWESAHL